MHLGTPCLHRLDSKSSDEPPWLAGLSCGHTSLLGEGRLSKWLHLEKTMGSVCLVLPDLPLSLCPGLVLICVHSFIVMKCNLEDNGF